MPVRTKIAGDTNYVEKRLAVVRKFNSANFQKTNDRSKAVTLTMSTLGYDRSQANELVRRYYNEKK